MTNKEYEIFDSDQCLQIHTQDNSIYDRFKFSTAFQLTLRNTTINTIIKYTQQLGTEDL